MDEKNKMTVPTLSDVTDKEPSSTDTSSKDTNEVDEDLELELDFISTYNSWSYNGLQTVSMTELFDKVYMGKPPIIDGLLYRGLYIFAGAPKLGKSFLMSQLAYHISTGTSLWGYNVHKGTVLYLALEDDYRRLQERLYRMFGVCENKDLFFSVAADKIDGNLEDQLAGFLKKHSETSLVIIDTLQKVREHRNDNYSYSSDYDVIGKMKKIADKHSICIILVHHTRKQGADDKFDMISGTNGLLGAADGAFILCKEKRTSNAAVLDISGRDQQDQKLYLVRNEETLAWELERAEKELWKKPPDPFLDKISDWLTSNGNKWMGSPTELVNALDLTIKPNILTQRLNVNADCLYNELRILYESKRCHDGRKIILQKFEA